MAVLRLFASIRVVAGTGRIEVDGDTVAEVIAKASERFGPEFAGQLQICRVWLNGEPASESDRVGEGDEVAILPPVSGG